MHGKKMRSLWLLQQMMFQFILFKVFKLLRFLFGEDNVILASVRSFQKKKNTEPRQMLLGPKKNLIKLNNLLIEFLFKDLRNITRLNGMILCKSFQ